MGSCSKDRHATACSFLFLKPPGPVIGWEFPAWKKISKTTRDTPGKWSELAMENRGKMVSLFASAAGDLPVFFYVLGISHRQRGFCCRLRSLLFVPVSNYHGMVSLPWWGWVKPGLASLWLGEGLTVWQHKHWILWLLNNHDVHKRVK